MAAGGKPTAGWGWGNRGKEAEGGGAGRADLAAVKAAATASCEGEHVGGLVTAAVLEVQRRRCLVARQQDAEIVRLPRRPGRPHQVRRHRTHEARQPPLRAGRLPDGRLPGQQARLDLDVDAASGSCAAVGPPAEGCAAPEAGGAEAGGAAPEAAAAEHGPEPRRSVAPG